MKDNQYLQQRHQTYLVRLPIPKHLRAAAGGKTCLMRSLKTHSLTEARRLRGPVVAELKAELMAMENPVEAALESALAIRRRRATASLAIDPDTGHSERGHVEMEAHELAEQVEKRAGIEAARRMYAVTESDSPVLSKMVEPFLKDNAKQVTPATVLINRKGIQNFLDWVTAQGLDGPTLMARDVTKKMTAQYVLHLKDRYNAPGTLNNSGIYPLQALWKWLIASTLVEDSPWQGRTVSLKTNKSAKEKRRAWKREELATLLTGGGRLELVDAVLIAMYTGLRIEELASAQIYQITTHPDGSIVFQVEEGKTEAAVRKVPIHPIIAPVIRRRLKAEPLAYLFPEIKYRWGANKKRGPWLGQAFTHYRRELGLISPYTVFHSLRKNAAGALESAGIPESTAALLLGHKRPYMTYGIYSDGGISPEMKREALEKITYGPEVDALAARLAATPEPGVKPIGRRYLKMMPKKV